MKTRCLTVAAALAFSGLVQAAPFQSTYEMPESEPTLIRDVSMLTATKDTIDRGYVYFRDGVIVAFGYGDVIEELIPMGEVTIVEGEGRWLTPGIIDTHSHLGDYPSPSYPATSDGNESTSPVTAEVWAEHSVWPQDPQFPQALAGGVTTLQILPGSANLIGGRTVTLKNVPGRTVMDMKFPGAPHGIKMACGENPKGVYGKRNQSPATRMANVAGYRQAFADAQAYQREWQKYQDSVRKAEGDATADVADMPERDIGMETLVGVLEGQILVHNHCYRADEMALMMEVAEEFGFQITAFHHATEAYKLADQLAENNICSAIWADWLRFKLEGFDAIKENAAILESAGACAVIHSDSPIAIQHLNQDAAKAMAAGQQMELDIDEADAIRWITINAAKALGIDRQTGSIEPGKMADLVLWDGNPFSVYTRVEKVFIDGALRYDRESDLKPVTDFELGHRRME